MNKPMVFIPALLSLALAAPAGAIGLTDCPDCGVGDAVAKGPTIRECAKTRYGVTVRVKLRDNGEFTRVRVSHPRGELRFHEPRVRRVELRTSGGDEWRTVELSVGPSSRQASASPPDRLHSVSATFKLRNGKAIVLGCSPR